MKTSMFVVEGPHDSAAVCRILKLCGFRDINEKKDVPKCFSGLIPSSYPFAGGSLDRIAPTPHFVGKGGEYCVAICIAAGDSEIAKKLCGALKNIDIPFLGQLMSIGILLDADRRPVSRRKSSIYNGIAALCRENEWESTERDILLYEQKIPYTMYAFPDDEGQGTLEDILLNGHDQYRDLKNLSSAYLKDIPEGYRKKWKNADEKKAQVGVISNVLKPGKANQMSILECEWFTAESIKNVETHKKFAEFIQNVVNQERGWA